MHEAQMWPQNSFVTLTYDNDNLPTDNSLVKWHVQDFLKRLRERHRPNPLRYFHSGEYGDQYQRPHYHLCLFNIAFADQKLWTRERDNNLYTSEALDQTWSHGRAIVGELTFESAAYVARYCCKKITGERSEAHYVRLHPVTGLTHQVEPEYATMSRGGKGGHGIGSTWLETFSADVWPYDEVIVRGHPCRPPRYYDKLLEQTQPGLLQALKLRRELEATTRAHDNTPARLEAKEKVKQAQFTQLKRSYDNET